MQNLTTASIGSRIVAKILDTFAFLPITALYFVSVGFAPLPVGVTGLILFQATWCFYLVYFHYRWGQTLGKKALSIKVVRLDGGPVSLKQAALRAISALVLAAFGATSAVIGALSIDVASFENLPFVERFVAFGLAQPGSQAIQAVSTLWLIAEIIAFLATPERRTVHDFIAGTRVISVKE